MAQRRFRHSGRRRPKQLVLSCTALALVAALALPGTSRGIAPDGVFVIRPAEPVFRVAPGLDLDGLLSGLECAVPSGFSKGKLRADCRLDRRLDDFRVSASGRFKLDVIRRDAGSKIKLRLELDGFIRVSDGPREDLRIVVKGGARIPAGDPVVNVPLATKACSGSLCERGALSLRIPLESGDGGWELTLVLDAPTAGAVAGTAHIDFADGASLAFDVAGVLDAATDRSSLVLAQVDDLRGIRLEIAKLRQTLAGGWKARLRYALFGQRDSVSVEVERLERL